MSSIFSHNLSAMFRDRAYASFGRGGSLKVAAAFVVGVAVTALLLKPVPEDARAAWAGGSSGVDVQAVQKDVAVRVAAHKQRKAAQIAAAAQAPALSATDKADLALAAHARQLEERFLGGLAAVDSGGSKEDDRVLDVLALEPLPLPVERQMIAELSSEDLGQ